MGGKLPTQTYNDIAKDKVDFDILRNRLKLKHLQAKQKFSKSYSRAEKYLQGKGVDIGKLREHSTKILGAGALTGSLLLTPPGGAKSLPPPQEILEKVRAKTAEASDFPQKLLVESLATALPDKPRPLTRNEEKYLEQVFENVVGVKAKATLEGEHLNTTYGLIGAE